VQLCLNQVYLGGGGYEQAVKDQLKYALASPRGERGLLRATDFDWWNAKMYADCGVRTEGMGGGGIGNSLFYRPRNSARFGGLRIGARKS